MQAPIFLGMILRPYSFGSGALIMLLVMLQPAATCASLVDRCELVYHGVGDALTLCARWGGILSKNV